MTPPSCPKCSSENSYPDGDLWICADCAFEWNAIDTTGGSKQEPETQGSLSVRDAFGTLLVDGDSVTLIKDLKLKGSSSTIKVGTKAKNIRLVEGDHNIDCKLDGFGAIQLKSEFVKKI